MRIFVSMDYDSFRNSLQLLDDRMKENLSQYNAIMKDVGELETKFCSCGFISEWVERSNRESMQELYDLLISKLSKP